MFCKVCGNEINDKAVICPKCGCAVEREINTEKVIKTDNSKGVSVAFSVFNYVSVGLICLTLTFFAMSIIFAEVLTLVEGTATIYIRSVFYLNISPLLVSFIFSLISYCSGAVSFVLGFSKHNKQKRFLSDVLFIINNCLVAMVVISCAWYLF